MKAQVNVSIGIPAYNEGKNIQQLLMSLLAQKEDSIKIKEIILLSDGSNDDTGQKVKAIKDRRIIFKDDHKRLGKSARLDQIFRSFTGDVLILMDADIVITDAQLLEKTILAANLSRSGIVGINALPLTAETFFEQVIETGVRIMKDIAKGWNNGNNYLSFKGCFLALDGKLAKAIHIPASVVNNDSYLYFAGVEKKYVPKYLSDISVYYRSPMNLADHIKQSSRHQNSRKELEKFFTLDWDYEYTMPVALVILSILKSILTRPIYFVAYLAVTLIAKVKRQTNIKSTWSVAKSTK
ncbi:MAG: glycosyltransferase family 2 protein [Candidatus Levybacteria bacterium]|nr:glycosyltransferase family 2 protein [Candidatus Levybacteria bacterium]